MVQIREFQDLEMSDITLIARDLGRIGEGTKGFGLERGTVGKQRVISEHESIGTGVPIKCPVDSQGPWSLF